VSSSGLELDLNFFSFTTFSYLGALLNGFANKLPRKPSPKGSLCLGSWNNPVEL